MNLYDVLIKYIEENKKINIDYQQTIDYIKELIRQIEDEYIDLENEDE